MRTEVMRVHSENLLINYRSNSMGAHRGMWCVRPLSLNAWLWPVLAVNAHNLLARAPLDGRRSRIGAHGKATSSKNQETAYACYARIFKPSPPIIYHGQGVPQGLAWGSHTGSW